MAFMIRSLTCVVVNQSGKELLLAHDEIAHGSYDSPLPASVPAGGSAQWASSTCGFMTGTEGLVVFDVAGTGGKFTVRWDNPFIGENSFSQGCSAYPPYVGSAPAGQDPDSGAPLTQDELTDNDDVLVTYTFGDTAKTVEGGEPLPGGRDQPGDNADPKATEAQPGKPVLVRDADLTNRKIVFIGVNDPQANKEASALEQAVGSFDTKGRMATCTSITPAGAAAFWRDWNGRPDEEWVDTIKTFQSGHRDKLLDMLKSSPHVSPVSPNTHTRKEQDFKRYELRAFAKVLAGVEAELVLVEQDEASGKLVEAAPMTRLAISAHHRPASADYWIGWFYSYNYLYLHIDDMAALGRVFPKAMAQVEDIILGACNTAHWKEKAKPFGDWEIVPRFLLVFPNVQTVWSYETKGPSDQAAIQDFLDWEISSRKSNAKEEIVAAALKSRFPVWGGKKRNGFPSIVWTREGSGLVHRPVPPPVPE